ncbi:MAG: hypothetical protein ACE5IZ_07705 [Dehalococcoidia bacterium]
MGTAVGIAVGGSVGIAVGVGVGAGVGVSVGSGMGVVRTAGVGVGDDAGVGAGVTVAELITSPGLLSEAPAQANPRAKPMNATIAVGGSFLTIIMLG